MLKTIYIRTNTANGRQYVGQTCDIKRRERDWRKLGTNYANQELNNDRIKYGLDVWTIDILEEVDETIADEVERKYISLYKTMTPYGYNHYQGGITGFTFEMGDETKKKISTTLKGKPRNHSKEGKKRIAEATRKRLSIPIDQIDEETGEVLGSFPSAKQAAKELGFSQGNISACANGGFYRKGKWVNRNQYNDYIWKKHM